MPKFPIAFFIFCNKCGDGVGRIEQDCGDGVGRIEQDFLGKVTGTVFCSRCYETVEFSS